MRLFSSLYSRVLRWSRHPHAPRYLVGLSFAESSFFPIPVDVMLAPMSLATPRRALYFASLTTLFSVLGGVAGYLIGQFAFDLIQPYLHEWGYWHDYERSQVWFGRWGVWAIFLAAFTPFPYKIFTITAGVMSMALIPFILASVVGRGARFFLVAGLMAWGGERMERVLHRYVDLLGWLMVVVFVGVVLYFQMH